MESGLMGNLLSGLFASVLTLLATNIVVIVRHREERKNLYRAIVSECRYNLSILDEVTNGTVNARGSFKRMLVEFFKTIRQQSISYALPAKLLSYLSRWLCEQEVFRDA